MCPPEKHRMINICLFHVAWLLHNVAFCGCSIATGLTQPIGNGRSPSVRNPYEDRAPPVDRYDDYRPSQPVDRYDDYRPSQPVSRQSSMMVSGRVDARHSRKIV